MTDEPMRLEMGFTDAAGRTREQRNADAEFMPDIRCSEAGCDYAGNYAGPEDLLYCKAHSSIRIGMARVARIEAEHERYREALERIEKCWGGAIAADLRIIARRALEVGQ